MKTAPSEIHLVHAIDTEGPLYESFEAKFERLEELFDIRGLPKTNHTIKQLQEGILPLDGREKEIQEFLNGHRINYMEDWSMLDSMLDHAMSADFRKKQTDSFGNGWVYNWFCLDHVGFSTNPRRRSMGFHVIHDHYAARMRETENERDEIQFHFHPMSTYKEAHRCATSYTNSPHLYETLARRVIEREYFPSAFRAGFQTERPDSHHFLEQWIPFDISNTATETVSSAASSTDLRNGRSGDWRKATAGWTPYHPHHDNYQLEGNCRRYIGRALNLLNRFANFDEPEMEKAFAQAQSGQPTIVGLASHDYRSLIDEVDFVRDLIARVSPRYSDVPYRFSGVSHAFREAMTPSDMEKIELSIELDLESKTDVPNLTIRCKKGKVFGPQPFFAIETHGQRFIHDNLDFDMEDGIWHYAFHPDTLPLSDVKAIGVAANDANGFTSVITERF